MGADTEVNLETVTGDAQTFASTGTVNGKTQTNPGARGALIVPILGAVSGTSPTLSCQLQVSPDGGTNWLNVGPALPNLIASSQVGLIGVFPANWSQAAGATPANLTSGANQQLLLNMPLPRTWRLVYTIGGTGPSIVLSKVGVSYLRA